MTILILTTAINRPELHDISFNHYRKMIKDYMTVIWVINIDHIKELPATSEETEENITKILSPHDNIYLHFHHSGGSWLNKAVRTVASIARGYLQMDSIDAVLYLEDDWGLKGKVPKLREQLIQDVGKFWNEKSFLVCLSERIFLTNIWINLQPQIWSPDLFRIFIKTLDHVQDTNRSAELILEQNFSRFKDISEVTKTKHKFFEDVGRKWLGDKGIKKRNKKSNNYSGENATYTMSEKKSEKRRIKGPVQRTRNHKPQNYKSYKDYVIKSRKFDTGWDVTKFTMDENGKKLGIDLPDNYASLVTNIRRFFKRQMKRGEGKIGLNGILTQFNKPLKCPEILELGEHFARELRDKLYGGECFVTYVHPYKNNKSDAKETASWLWHYDNVCYGLIKIMVYLTDTDKENGAFLVLKNDKDEFITMEPSKVSPGHGKNVKFSETRYSEKQLKPYREQGFENYYIEGKTGTFVVFNNNILHKATKANKEPGRMCVVYHFRPFHEELENHIDPKITGDWRGGSNVKSKCYAYDVLK